MLGFDVSKRTVSRWVQRAPRDQEQVKPRLAFLRNHREAIAAMDFFTVPTVTFGILYGFFIIAHDRRRILHFNITRHPTETWVVQQLREAFPYDSVQKYLTFDRDTKLGFDVIAAVKSMGGKPIRTSLRSPWQNGVAKRWVESCRREPLHTDVLEKLPYALSNGCDRSGRKTELDFAITTESADFLLAWSRNTIRFPQSAGETQPVTRSLSKLLVG